MRDGWEMCVVYGFYQYREFLGNPWNVFNQNGCLTLVENWFISPPQVGVWQLNLGKQAAECSLIMFDWDLHDAIARVSTYKLDATQWAASHSPIAFHCPRCKGTSVAKIQQRSTEINGAAGIQDASLEMSITANFGSRTLPSGKLTVCHWKWP